LGAGVPGARPGVPGAPVNGKAKGVLGAPGRGVMGGVIPAGMPSHRASIAMVSLMAARACIDDGCSLLAAS
jgi:hypothetical protein